MKRLLTTAAALAAAVAVVWAVLNLTVLAGTDTHGSDVESFELKSEAVPGTHPVSVVVPDGAGDGSGRGMLIFLHGRNGDSESYTDEEPFFEALEAQGENAPVVAFPDGGESSYWHDRDTGRWGSYVTDEVIREVAERYGADPERVAIGGISMGGFGALNLAMHNPGRFCAAGGHSPALFETGGESAAGAFDDAEDFAENDVIAAARNDPSAFDDLPVWLDAGSSDPFVPGVTAMGEALSSSGAEIRHESGWKGGHDDDYWNRHWGQYLKFYATALASCEV